MKLNLLLLSKYVLALIVGLVFIDIQTRLVGFSASIPFSLNEYEWAKTHSELSLFIMNFVTNLIPLALVTLMIGYLVARLLKANNIMIVFLIILPSLLLVLPSIDLITQLSFWVTEIARLLVMFLGLWFIVNKYNPQVSDNIKVIE